MSGCDATDRSIRRAIDLGMRVAGRAPMRISRALLLSFLATAACGGVIDLGDTSSAQRSDDTQVPSQPGLAASASSSGAGVLHDPRDGTTTVLARFTGGVTSMTADATTLYLGGDGGVVAIPKAGGATQTVFSEAPEWRSGTMGIAVDDTYVYFTGAGARRLSRVPKAGGQRVILSGDLEYPYQIALDATHVYVAVNGTGPYGTTPSGAIVRIPKAGGAIEVLASNQRFPYAIALAGDWVYFGTSATDYQAGPDGGLARVRRTGGPVEVLTNQVRGQIERMIVRDDAVLYVDRKDRVLVRVPLAGGPPVQTPTSSFEWPIATDGTSIFAFEHALGSMDARLLELDPEGQTAVSRAEWSYPYPKTDRIFPGAKWSDAALAAVADASRVYWVDFASDSVNHQVVIRSAPH